MQIIRQDMGFLSSSYIISFEVIMLVYLFYGVYRFCMTSLNFMQTYRISNGHVRLVVCLKLFTGYLLKPYLTHGNNYVNDILIWINYFISLNDVKTTISSLCKFVSLYRRNKKYSILFFLWYGSIDTDADSDTSSMQKV